MRKLILSGFIALFGSGCGGDGTTAPQLDLQPARTGLSGSYKDDRAVVYFEAIRGEALGDHAGIIDPDAPPYEVGVRWSDQLGRPLLVRLRGDDPGPIDGNATDEIDTHERRADMALVREAVEALRVASVPPELAVEFDALIATGEDALAPDLDPEPPAFHPEGTGTVKVYKQVVEIRRKDAFFNGFPADHSAIRLRSYASDGTYMGALVSSNHGTSASDPTMTTKCSTTFLSSAVYPQIYYETCPTLWGPTAGGHLCNDDTMNQFNSAAWGSPLYNTSTCFNWGPHLRAPNCGGGGATW